MANIMKPISVPDATKKALMIDFKKYLATLKTDSGKVNFTATITSKNAVEKPIVYFSTTAYAKMQTLVQCASTEIGWHGTVERNKNVFIVKDIILYPQTITATTVTTDDTLYTNWLGAQPDEIFNLIRFQGHSHVHMVTTPSGVDLNYYNDILETLRKDDYYIFAILNKRNEITMQIYDFTQNTLFENADITLDVIADDGTLMKQWTTAQIDQYATKPTTPVTHVYSSAGRDYNAENRANLPMTDNIAYTGYRGPNAESYPRTYGNGQNPMASYPGIYGYSQEDEYDRQFNSDVGKSMTAAEKKAKKEANRIAKANKATLEAEIARNKRVYGSERDVKTYGLK